MLLKINSKLFLWNLAFQREIVKTHTIKDHKFKRWQNLYQKIARSKILYRTIFPLLTTPNNVRFDEYGVALSFTDFNSEGFNLEIGCGRSSLPSFLARMGMKVICLDIEGSQIHAHKNACKILDFNRKMHFIVADAENLPFRSRSIFQIISVSTFEHVPNDAKAAKEVGRVLSNPGKCILSLPYTLRCEMQRIISDGSLERWYTNDYLEEHIVMPSCLVIKKRKFIISRLLEGKYLRLILEILQKTPWTNLFRPPFGERLRDSLTNKDMSYTACIVLELAPNSVDT